jgi:hypothetical protein
LSPSPTGIRASSDSSARRGASRLIDGSLHPQRGFAPLRTIFDRRWDRHRSVASIPNGGSRLFGQEPHGASYGHAAMSPSPTGIRASSDPLCSRDVPPWMAVSIPEGDWRVFGHYLFRPELPTQVHVSIPEGDSRGFGPTAPQVQPQQIVVSPSPKGIRGSSDPNWEVKVIGLFMSPSPTGIRGSSDS